MPVKDASGAFVTLKKHGQLRGCIGTLECRRSLAEEIARVAPRIVRVEGEAGERAVIGGHPRRHPVRQLGEIDRRERKHGQHAGPQLRVAWRATVCSAAILLGFVDRLRQVSLEFVSDEGTKWLHTDIDGSIHDPEDAKEHEVHHFSGLCTPCDMLEL